MTGEMTNRINRILEDPIFKERLEEIEAAEVNRRFCRHGLEHLLSVSRIMYIISLEKDMKISKDIIYACGLLHDIGRWSEEERQQQITHAEAGRRLAQRILKSAGYDETEIRLISGAIAKHGHANEASEDEKLVWLLSEADRLSRNCFSCSATQECFWDEKLKNSGIVF